MGKTKKEQSEDKEMAKTEKARRKMMEEVAKHIHSKVSNKPAVIKGQKIEFFNGQNAVDSLMESKWTQEPKDPMDTLTPYFPNRAAANDYCLILLRHHFFVRLNKIEVKPKPEITSSSSSSKEGESKGLRKRGDKVTDSPRAKKQGDGSDSESSKRKKRKFKLEVHLSQTFVDSPDELYFWQYDPPSRGTYLIGFAVVLGAIALTLQPLWPDSTRAGLWYLSMGLFGLMGTMVMLIIARWFVFGLVQISTIGKVHFWVFPNLDNEKCGFIESFRPLYSFEVKKSKKKSKKEKGGTKGEESKESAKREESKESTKGEESKESTESSAAAKESKENKNQNGSNLVDKQQITEMPIKLEKSF